MKKLYMLIAAMLVFSVSFAQISPKQGYQMDSKTPIMPKVMKGEKQPANGSIILMLLEAIGDLIVT